MPSFVSHLEGAIDGARLAAGRPQTLHKERPLWVRYDLEAVGRALKPSMLADREPTMWRYRELLPPRDELGIISLGEGMTPLISCARLGRELGLSNLWVKDESQLPTGSFKSRGLAMAITPKEALRIHRNLLHQRKILKAGGFTPC